MTQADLGSDDPMESNDLYDDLLSVIEALQDPDGLNMPPEGNSRQLAETVARRNGHPIRLDEFMSTIMPFDPTRLQVKIITTTNPD